jgi:hypothetical protein
MPTLRIHYDGWIALPPGLRQYLKLNSGDRLDVQLVDGVIMLRPANVKRAPAKAEPAIKPSAVTAAPVSSLETALPQKRPRGRPRKVHSSELMLAIAGDPLPSPKRKPGRPRKVRLEEAEPVIETRPSSVVGDGALWKLRPKAEPTARSSDPVPPAPAPPPRHLEPTRTGGSQEREERRPFRNVEIRKLGSGRGHNRL